MKKFLLLFLAVFLVSCGANAGSETVDSETEAAGTTQPAEGSTTVTQPAPADNADTGVGLPGQLTPALTVAEASVVRAQDHILGSNDPAVVIIEYGDFQ